MCPPISLAGGNFQLIDEFDGYKYKFPWENIDNNQYFYGGGEMTLSKCVHSKIPIESEIQNNPLGLKSMVLIG